MSQDVIEPMTEGTSPETESDSDEDVNISSADHFTVEGFKAGEKAEARAQVTAGMRSAPEGLSFPDSVVQKVMKYTLVHPGV